MAYMTEGRDSWTAPYEGAMHAAGVRIGPARRRLSDHQAEQIVAEEFLARGIDILPSAAISIARSLRHPLWPFLHPLQARRDGWTSPWGRRKDGDIAGPRWSQPDVDVWLATLGGTEDEVRAEAELVHEAERAFARLGARVDRCWGVRSFEIGCHRTLDGFEFEVCIDPWSPRLARRVERRARPTAVVVKPLYRSE